MTESMPMYIEPAFFTSPGGPSARRDAWPASSEIPAYQEGPVRGEPDAVVTRLAEVLPLIDAWR